MRAHHPEPSRRRRRHSKTVRQFIAPVPAAEPEPADPHAAWFDEPDSADWQPLEADALAPGPAISTPTILSIAAVVMMLVAAVSFAL